MVTLIHHPNTRSSRFVFLLEELGAPYELHTLGDMGDPTNPHPHKKVPALLDEDALVFESSAIALYLTDKFPQNKLGPLPGEVQRGAYLSWLAYYCGVMEPAWVMAFFNVELPRVAPGWPPVAEVLAHVVATLERGPYILGDAFSAVDVLVGTTFAMFMGGPTLPKTPLIKAYVQRVLGRPAYARAMEKAGDTPRQ